MGNGGLTKGKSHAEGGIPMKVKNTGQNIEVEGGEIIINKKNVADTKKHSFDGEQLTKCEIASKINEANGNGVKIDCGSVAGKKYKYDEGGQISEMLEYRYDPKQISMRFANAGMLVAGQILSDPQARQDIMQMMSQAQQMKQQYEEGGKLQGALMESIMPYSQKQSILETTGRTRKTRGFEGDEVFTLLGQLNKNLNEIPPIYAQDGKGKNAIAYLHYFNSSSDRYITELDKDNLEGFGFTILNGDTQNAEFGYIPLTQFTQQKASYWDLNLDLNFNPTTLNQVFRNKGYNDLIAGEKETPKKEIPKAEKQNDILNADYENAKEKNIGVVSLINTYGKGGNHNNYSVEEKEFLLQYTGYDEFSPSKQVIEKMLGLAYKYMPTDLTFTKVSVEQFNAKKYDGFATNTELFDCSPHFVAYAPVNLIELAYYTNNDVYKDIVYALGFGTGNLQSDDKEFDTYVNYNYELDKLGHGGNVSLRLAVVPLFISYQSIGEYLILLQTSLAKGGIAVVLIPTDVDTFNTGKLNVLVDYKLSSDITLGMNGVYKFAHSRLMVLQNK